MTLATSQLMAAQTQARDATIGIPLESMDRDRLPSIELFRIGPMDTGGALRYAAYWSAIAGRALGSRSLGVAAGAYAVKAVGYVVSFDTSGMSDILNGAANGIVQATSGATGEGLGIANYAAATLRAASTPSAIAKAGEQDDSAFGQLRHLMDQFRDTLKVVAIGGAVVGAATIAGVAWWLIHRYRKRNG